MERARLAAVSLVDMATRFAREEARVTQDYEGRGHVGHAPGAAVALAKSKVHRVEEGQRAINRRNYSRVAYVARGRNRRVGEQFEFQLLVSRARESKLTQYKSAVGG